MEAPGIEPGSENRFTKASTCVSSCWMSLSDGQEEDDVQVSLPLISPDARKRDAGLARICDTHVTPQAGFLVSTAHVPGRTRLRSESEVVVRSWIFSECFTRSPDT